MQKELFLILVWHWVLLRFFFSRYYIYHLDIAGAGRYAPFPAQ